MQYRNGRSQQILKKHSVIQHSVLTKATTLQPMGAALAAAGTRQVLVLASLFTEGVLVQK